MLGSKSDIMGIFKRRKGTETEGHEKMEAESRQRRHQDLEVTKEEPILKFGGNRKHGPAATLTSDFVILEL